MTIKEMIKKVEAYNEVANVMGTEKAVLKFEYGFGWGKEVEDLASFKKYMKDEFIKEMVDAIMNFKEYEFDKDFEISFEDRFGKSYAEEISFYLYTK